MTLARKTILRLAVLTAVLVSAGGAAIWALVALQHLVATTREEYEEFRQIRDVERHVWRASLALARDDAASALHDLSAGIDALGAFVFDHGASVLGPEHATQEQVLARRCLAALGQVRDALSAPDAPAAAGAQFDRLVAAHRDLKDLVDVFERVVVQVHTETGARFRLTLAALVALFVLVLLIAITISRLQYRAVIGPLRYIRDGVRRLAGGELQTRLAPRGDTEFTDLQADFNRMAAELESLYRELEQRVTEQSARLAVSERLASVGFLAAGVAHEINNPLAIMSGHAESLLRRLRSPNSKTQPPELLRDLEIIRDEAFRAKGITQGLLDLSRNGDAARRPVSLWRVIDDVCGLLRASRFGDGVAVETAGSKDDALLCSAAELEIRQVVLNLAMNAVQAVPRAGGRIELHAGRRNGWVELTVQDNGCGMSAETLQHVFEPFFTARKGQAGVGLGLAISHAIVRRHGGEILASSPGIGRGSAFTLRLPALAEADTRE